MSGSESALRALTAIAGCVLASVAIAQHPTVTDADIERAKRAAHTVNEGDIETARRRNRMPTDQALSRQPTPPSPKIEALPRSATTPPPDLEAIAKGYESTLRAGAGTPTAAGPALLVFVSFSMPEPALARLVEQATRAGATLMLRGFVDGSLKQTVARAQRLIGQRRVGFQIDPQAFDRFAVSRVPTFVLLRDGAEVRGCADAACLPSDAFVAVAGDVSIDYALEFMQRTSQTFTGEATAFLKRLKG